MSRPSRGPNLTTICLRGCANVDKAHIPEATKAHHIAPSLPITLTPSTMEVLHQQKGVSTPLAHQVTLYPHHQSRRINMVGDLPWLQLLWLKNIIRWTQHRTVEFNLNLDESSNSSELKPPRSLDYGGVWFFRRF